VCQKDPGLAYKNVIVNVYLDTLGLLNKLQKVAEIAYTPSVPEIDRKLQVNISWHKALPITLHEFAYHTKL